ncbi:hypothetical protein CKM354_001217700 [Cercospora kikuchii]|uniref:DUF221-domain-containing protein n=1 Tax=Cercospora kikuchii TaxID=84275 RepID=A0A9P3FLI0_9PEZI|nr:uncharacterized protein CKM354_001217700 [Cercospora kikuchii]GIZ49140.1 hypothetical protein CKM354_001217700 [Cercospora kikuchii]
MSSLLLFENNMKEPDDNNHHNHTRDDRSEWENLMGATNPRDTTIQIVLSLLLGTTAFFAFCFLRPRWKNLYAARKRTSKHAGIATLPELPDTMFGWILPLWRISEQQVLASAGLDAYVFLTFFKMAMKFLIVTLGFSLVVIKPVHDAYPDDDDDDDFGKNGTHHNDTDLWIRQGLKRSVRLFEGNGTGGGGNWTVPFFPENLESDYLWMYIVFAYLFSGILIYLVISTTRKVIEVRQEFLGTQTTVTDRTIRLSGIPKDLQDEERIKEFIESLEIGHVERVVLCRNWRDLDKAMAKRTDLLRKLEEAWTIHLGYRRIERNLETLPIAQPSPPEPLIDADANDDANENGNLMGRSEGSVRPYSKPRPKTTIRYGRFWFQRTQVDAIDYYTERLREADEHVMELRKKEFPTTPLAFVTMDSVASCQMAIQAVLDPSPLQFIAKQSPEPVDVIWENTYISKRRRIIRNWTVTSIIVFLTIFWSVLFIPIAGLLNVETIGKVVPGLADVLKDHKYIRSLVNTQLPTAIASLLMVLVPYLYYYLSWCQGQISKGDIELSIISKNFFFTFFNFFIVFTVLGTASKFYEVFAKFGDAIRDIQKVAWTMAYSLGRLLNFYVNFIILQGVGLFPFRMLEVGSVCLYPIMLIGAKTPRDYAELVQPPVFSYGFYLPNAMLIFIICMVYSVLRSSWQVLLAGFLYFALGHYCYKYQLLYAMDHRQQTSGRAWTMICERIFIGMILFQLTTAGQLILKGAIARSVMMVPLLVTTVWVMIMYGKTYQPLMRYIALSAVKRNEHYDHYTDQQQEASHHSTPRYAASLNSTNLAPETSIWAGRDPNAASAVECSVTLAVRTEEEGAKTERNLPFINPSLVAPLHGVWIGDKPASESTTQARLVDVDDEEEREEEERGDDLV